MRYRAIATLCFFAIAAVVALKYPLAGLGICIACLIVYLKSERPSAGKPKNSGRWVDIAPVFAPGAELPLIEPLANVRSRPGPTVMTQPTKVYPPWNGTSLSVQHLLREQKPPMRTLKLAELGLARQYLTEFHMNELLMRPIIAEA